jgi:capsular polysaccharide biosynthesis protein
MKIYSIEENGKWMIGHWFWLTIGALEKIPEFGKEKIGLCFKDEDFTPYIFETFEIFKNQIELVPYTDDHIKVDCVKVVHSQNGCIEPSFLPPEVLPNVKNLFLSSIENVDVPIEGYEKVYIRRNLSHLSLGNAKKDGAGKFLRRRQVVNEDELVESLSKIGFKIINLEDYHVRDKVRIFHNASVILGPNGGGMCMTFVAKPGTKYIEILSKNPHQYIDMYRDMCNQFNLEFHRFSDVEKVDSMDNVIVDIQSLMNYLGKVL